MRARSVNRVWLTSGERGLIGEPVSLAASRTASRSSPAVGRSGARRAGDRARGDRGAASGVVGRARRRWPGSLRLFAPSVSQAARAQLASQRFKTTTATARRWSGWLVGAAADAIGGEALLGVVWHRRQLVDARRVAQQRLHDQLNALCPGLSAPVGHGRALAPETGWAGWQRGRVRRARATMRSLLARSPGRLSEANAHFWSERWKQLLAPPADAGLRASRLGCVLDRSLGPACGPSHESRTSRPSCSPQRRQVVTYA